MNSYLKMIAAVAFAVVATPGWATLSVFATVPEWGALAIHGDGELGERAVVVVEINDYAARGVGGDRERGSAGEEVGPALGFGGDVIGGVDALRGIKLRCIGDVTNDADLERAFEQRRKKRRAKQPIGRRFHRDRRRDCRRN